MERLVSSDKDATRPRGDVPSDRVRLAGFYPESGRLRPQRSTLLHFHCGASFSELLFDGLSLFFVHTFFDRLGRTVYQVLSLF